MPINASKNKSSRKPKLKQDMSELSIKEYAEHRNVSVAAVRKAIKAGRITLNQNEKLNPKSADAEWFENTNPAKQRNSADNNSSDDKISYHRSRAIREDYNAKLTQLQFERESGKLIPIEEVKVSAFNSGRRIRDRLLNMPDHIAPQLVGKTSIFEIKNILKSELTKILEELSKNPYHENTLVK
jgi:hypothetical protein